MYVRPAVLTALMMLFPATVGCTATFSENFVDSPNAGAWELHEEGAGVARFDSGALLLELSSPTKGKHAWADLRLVAKLPLTLEWDQQVAKDSPHFYTAGIVLRDSTDDTAAMGLTGAPLEHVATFPGQRGDKSLEPGKWYRLKLELTARNEATLTVAERESGEEVGRFTAQLGQLRGQLVRLSFFHNQERDRGPDEYAQDRGASRHDNLRLTAAALHEGDMSSYRDADLRGFDLHRPMTFNRTMRWLGEKEGVRGAVLAYDAAAEVMLTGTQQAASWQVNRLCTMQPKEAAVSIFTRPNDLDGPDVAAVRSFQWCVRQHPVLAYTLRPEAGPCWLKVTLVCPYLGDGIEVFRCASSAAPQTGKVDLGRIYADRGLGYHQFAEIGVFVYQDRPADKAAAQGSCDVSLKLTGAGALLTTPPIARTAAAAKRGIKVAAVLVGPDGNLRHGDGLDLVASCRRNPEQPNAARPLTLLERGAGGVFVGTLGGLEVGDYVVDMKATDAQGRTCENALSLSVTEGDFARWAPDHLTYQLNSGRVLPTLLGDLYAWVPMLDPASPDRQPIVSAKAWRGLSADDQRRVQLVKLRTLNQAEIAAHLQAHAASGMRVIRLAPNVSPHEAYLDAGGHVSMHGLETLLAVLAECRRFGLKALVNVFHYPYWSPGTGSYPPWQQYLDAGYKGAQSFRDPESGVLLKQYLGELLLFLCDDPAVLGYSLTGENDQSHGAEWINDLFAHVVVCDPNHLVTQEQGGGIEHCAGGTPWAYDGFKPTTSGGLGYRTYYTGGLQSDGYFMVCGRFYRLNPPVFTAEFASGPGWYGGFAQTWTHPDFLTKVRDNCWTALLTQQTMCVSWSAPWTQEERALPQLCAEQLDWNKFHRKRPLVGLRLTNVDRPELEHLVAYEAALAKLGVDYDYVWEGGGDANAAGAFPVVLDAREAFSLPSLSPGVLAARPVVVTGDYSVNYLLGEDPVQMIAFVKNTAGYKLGPGYGQSVNELHRQRTAPSALKITLQGLPASCRYTLFDVDERKQLGAGACQGDVELDVGMTAHDFAVVVR